MKRRLIVILIGLIAILSVVGCGKKKNNQPAATVEQVNDAKDADRPKNEEKTETKNEAAEKTEMAWEDPCIDAVQLTDEVFRAYAKEEWQIAYKDILDSMYDGLEYVHADIKDANYYLYDIDKDGIPELIVKRGSNENDYMSDFYYWDGNEVKYAGEEASGRLQYYSNPDGNGIIEYSMHMASGHMTKSCFVDGKIVADDFSYVDDLMSRYEMDLEADPVPVAEIVKGSEELKYYCPKYTYPILEYLGPVYASGREQLSDSEFEDMIYKIQNDNVQFYWVPTENYVLKDYVFKPNKIEMADFLLKDGVLFDDTEGMNVFVKSKNFMDFNGDGYTECLLELRNAVNNDLSLVLFAYQHGDVYAYTSKYMGDWGLKVEDGEIFASGIYNGGMKISYEYCLDQSKMHIEKEKVVILSDDARESLDNYYRGEIKSEGGELAVAYIGCAGNYAGQYLTELFEDTKEEFKDLKFMWELGKCHVVKQPGEEVYVLVPADKSYVISVYEQEWGDFDPDIYPKRGKLLYKAEPGEIVVVRCNQSDIVSNIEISMDMNGRELVYSPNMSLEDGSLVTEDGVYDFGKTNLLSEDEYYSE